MTSTPPLADAGSAVVLVTRSGVAAPPVKEMQELAAAVATAQPGAVTYAFTEQGEPSLRDVVHRLRDEGRASITLVPLLLPMEPNFVAFLTRSVQRWRKASPGAWPLIRIGDAGPSRTTAMTSMLHELVRHAHAAPPIDTAAEGPEGSVVHGYRRRVLVCMGGPCQAAGATLVLCHLRNEQKRLNLRTSAGGTAVAKASCLGPCGLAPVVQVYPEGTLYGGIDEPSIDRIIDGHVLHDRVVDDLAYRPSPVKQTLRHG